MSKKSYIRDFVGDMKVCPVCGKDFNVLCYEDWVYKRDISTGSGRNTKSKRLIFCSWGCIRKWDKEHAKELEDRRKRRRKAQP